MPSITLRFFSPLENTLPTAKPKLEEPRLTGYISAAGKLVLPLKTIEQLGLDAATAHFRIGTQLGKRKLNTLYLVPSTEEDTNAFGLVKGAKSFTIALAGILEKNGLAYQTTKFTFILKPFEFEAGLTAYELPLTAQANDSSGKTKPSVGKRRGRKSKEENPID